MSSCVLSGLTHILRVFWNGFKKLNNNNFIWVSNVFSLIGDSKIKPPKLHFNGPVYSSGKDDKDYELKRNV